MSRIADLKVSFLLLFGLILVAAGCSKQNSNSPIDPNTGKHSIANWASPDVHGAWAKKSVNEAGFASCQACHGDTFTGGNSKTSCFTCHGASAPHPGTGSWAASGAITHQTTDESNASVCADCHTSGANSPLGTLPPAPAGTAPGCFNSTLCHGAGHPAGWNAANQHGASAKLANGFAGCQSCHGADFAGSGSAVTCLNTGGCHGAGINAPSPHPQMPWNGATTHTNTDTSNAAVCAACHALGDNLASVPVPTNLVGGTPGCFNSTLCHGQMGHAVGWVNPGQHGAAAKSTPSVTNMTGFSTCQTCHGNNFAGSTAVTCLNTAGCHGLAVSSPHAAAPWISSLTSTMTHTTTNVANATICGGCHESQPDNGNHAYVTPSGPVGCFNSTLCHGVKSDSCIICHAAIQDAPNASIASGGTVTRRDNIVAEFASTWSHKRAAAGAVTDADCIICHMEGNASTKTRDAAYHANGTIELRDPDLDGTIKQVTFSGTPGSYASTGTDASPVRFSRNLNSTTIETDTAAMQINFCLKCHDADGALSPNARVTSGTALKPFNTTVASTGTYYLNNVAAGNAAGAVVDVNSSFDTNNASYHPVRGKQNNGYIGNTRLKGPWTALSPNKTAGGTTTYGYLISCWDCHAPAGTASTATISRTVTAHGGAATIRADYHIAATAGAPSLCTFCHTDNYFTGATNHGSGSAFGTGGDSSRYTIGKCSTCHGSSNNTRPWRGVDVHGFNQWAELRTDTVTPANSLKSGPATATGHRPYAFIRTGNLAHVNPLTVAAGDGTWTPAGNKPGCVRSSAYASGYSCGNSHGTTGPGGAF